MKTMVLGLSGGMDSATLFGWLLHQGYKVHCCIFYYGSTHGKYEIVAAEQIIEYFQQHYPGKVIKHSIDISKAMSEFSSSLLLASKKEIPEGHYNDDNMKKTVVPGRNLIFASILAGLAETVGAKEVALGVHSGDHHIYPDCRIEFIKALDTAIYLSTDRKVEVRAPFANYDKADILRIGYSLEIPVPYHITRTCYKNQPISCGKCGSCNERLEAFQKIGCCDPIEYENRGTTD